jgi:hypothetical protein
MGQLLTTAYVPPEFFQTAFLVGQIPQRTLSSDPRIRYTLYIPPKHYNPDPHRYSSDDHTWIPSKLPLFVHIQGTNQGVSTHDFIDFADSVPCAVLIPLFAAGPEDLDDLGAYKLLISRSLRADLALLSILEEVGSRWLGVDVQKIFMFGWSEGAQFVHRFMYLYPERLAAVSMLSLENVTKLDDTIDWPRGVADVERLFGRKVNLGLLRSVPVQLLRESEHDDTFGGQAFWNFTPQESFSPSGGEDGQKGESLQTLVPTDQEGLDSVSQLGADWKRCGIRAQFGVVETVRHDTIAMHGDLFEFQRLLMQDYLARAQERLS